MNDDETTEEYTAVNKKPLAENPKRTEHKKKKSWGLLAGAVVVVAGLGVGSYYGYDYYMHADDVTVPQAQKFVEYEEDRDHLCDEFEKLSLNCSVEWTTHDEANRGNLLSQSIATGTVVSPGSKVELTYSDGPESSSFPNLVGQELEQSREDLYNMGIVVSDVKEIDSNSVPAGRIVSTSIEPGTTVNHGTEVVIEIANGKVLAPDWVGETKEFVEADAKNKNLDITFKTIESADVPAGVVVNQSVAAGKIAEDGKIEVTIAESPETETLEIPNVVDLTEEEAVSQLAALGFSNITVVTVQVDNVEESTVVDVTPGIRTSVEADELITLVVTNPTDG